MGQIQNVIKLSVILLPDKKQITKTTIKQFEISKIRTLTKPRINIIPYEEISSIPTTIHALTIDAFIKKNKVKGY